MKDLRWLDWALCVAAFAFVCWYMARTLLHVRRLSRRSAAYCARLDVLRDRVKLGPDAAAEAELLRLLKQPPGLEP